MRAAETATVAQRRKILFAVLAGLLTLLGCVLGGEILVRLFWKEAAEEGADERSLSYRYDAELGWFPVPNSALEFVGGSRPIRVQHNADGFRDREHGTKDKPRIAFLGDSFVWGYEAEQPERFTEKLQARLPGWEVVNLGVSGYGTDQEWLLLQRWFDRYRPDVVVLVFSDNDVDENTLNYVHRGYYKPYFVEAGSKLEARGVPVPKSERYYAAEHPWLFKSRLVQMLCGRYIAWTAPRRVTEPNPTWALLYGVKSYVESKGAKFVLAFGTDVEAGKKKAFCERVKADYLFLLEGPAMMSWEYMYNSGGHHWTPKGNEFVASKIYDFLAGRGLLERVRGG